jgi:hypothetical protein
MGSAKEQVVLRFRKLSNRLSKADKVLTQFPCVLSRFSAVSRIRGGPVQNNCK